MSSVGMANIIDLCNDGDVQFEPSALPGTPPYITTLWSKATSGQFILPNRSESSPQTAERTTAASLLAPPSPAQSQAYPEAFYIDFIAVIEHTFPWAVFATRHSVSQDDLRHLFFVLVTLPLSDPDDNAKRLRVAQGARKRFAEWQQAWEETLANINASCTGSQEYNVI